MQILEALLKFTEYLKEVTMTTYIKCTAEGEVPMTEAEVAYFEAYLAEQAAQAALRAVEEAPPTIPTTTT